MFYVILLLGIFWSSFSCNEEQILLRQSIFRFFKRVATDPGIYCTATGEWGPGDISGLYYTFHKTKCTPGISEARVIVMKMVNMLAHEVNSNAPLRPYLHDYPFRGVMLQLIFDDVVNGHLSAPLVSYVSFAKNRLIYWCYGNHQNFFDQKIIYEESLEEALKLLGGEHQP